MSIAAMILVTDRAVRRRARFAATLRHDSVPTDAEIVDLSVSGFHARTAGDLAVGDWIDVSWAGAGTNRAIVVRKGADGYGCVFEHGLSQTVVARDVAVDTVIPIGPGGRQAELSIARWRFRQRLAAITIGAVAGWAGVIGLGWALYPLL